VSNPPLYANTTLLLIAVTLLLIAIVSDLEIKESVEKGFAPAAAGFTAAVGAVAFVVVLFHERGQ